MHVNETKFERNSSLEYYHMTCIWEDKTGNDDFEGKQNSFGSQ